MAYEQEQSLLVEQRAERLAYEVNESKSFAKLTRGWQISTGIMRSTLLTFMGLYVSAKNYPTQQRWINDPQADSHGTNPDGTAKNPYPGRWRLVNWYYSDKLDRYVQELVRVEITTPESAARKLSFSLSNQSGKLTLIRYWPRIDPLYSKELLTINANQKVTDGIVVDPMADGVTYTGSWMAKTTVIAMTEDDEDQVVQELVKEGDQSLNLKYGSDPLHVTYELWRVDASVTKINDFMAQTGSEAVDVGTPIDFKWDEPELGITKLVKVDWNEDRSANLHAIYSTANDLARLELFTAGEGAPGKLTIQDNYISTTERSFGWNLPVSALKTYSDYYCPAVKVVNTKNEFKISRRDEHTFDFEGLLVTFVPVDSGDVIVEDNDEKTVTVRTGSFLTGGTYFTPNTGEYVRPTVVPDGTLVELDVKDNAYGSKDAIKKTTVFHSQTSSSTEKKGLVETIVTTEKKADVAATVTTPAVNLISKAENKTRSDGLVDSAKQDTTKIPTTLVDGVVVEKDAFHTKTLSKGLNKTSLTPPSAFGTARGEHNGAGGLDTETVEIVEVDATATDGEVALGATTSIVKHSAKAVAETTAVAAIGVKSTVVNENTAGGNFKTEKKTETVSDLSSTSAELMTVETKSTEKHTASGTALAVTGDAVQNAKKSVNQVRDPVLGTYKGEIETITKVSVTLVDGVVIEKDAFHTKTLVKGINKTALTAPTAFGTASGEHNGFGGLDTETVEIAEIDATASDSVSAPGIEETVEKHSASATAASGSSAGVGEQVIVKNEATQGGNFKSEKTTKTVADMAGTEGSKTILKTETVETHTAATTAMEVGTVVVNQEEIVQQKRDPVMGTYEGKKSTIADLPYTPIASMIVKNDGVTVEKLTIGLRALVEDLPAILEAAADSGKELIVKAITDKGGIDYNLIERVLRAVDEGGAGVVYTVSKSEAIEIQPSTHGYRLPVSATPQGQITGWAEYYTRIFTNRKVTITVTRQYFLTQPNIDPTISVEALPMGGGETVSVEAIQLKEGLWAVETKEITALGWSRIVTEGVWDRTNMEVVLLNWYSVSGIPPPDPNA